MSAEILTLDEARTLETCEATIAAGLQTFYAVGAALATIRDQRLYRAHAETFEDYCREKWAIGSSRARQLISATAIVEELRESVTVVTLPASERQARALAAVEPERRAEVWQQAVETAPGGKVTAAHIAATARPAKKSARPALVGPGDEGWDWTTATPAQIAWLEKGVSELERRAGRGERSGELFELYEAASEAQNKLRWNAADAGDGAQEQALLILGARLETMQGVYDELCELVETPAPPAYWREPEPEPERAPLSEVGRQLHLALDGIESDLAAGRNVGMARGALNRVEGHLAKLPAAERERVVARLDAIRGRFGGLLLGEAPKPAPEPEIVNVPEPPRLRLNVWLTDALRAEIAELCSIRADFPILAAALGAAVGSLATAEGVPA